MSDPDKRARGGEPPLTLDKRRAPRSRGPVPVTLIVSVLILIVAAGVILWLYRGGVRGPNASPPTVGAPVGKDRTAAPAQTQAPDAAAGLSIYKDNGAAANLPAFTAPPEEPSARTNAAGSQAAPPAASVPTTQATALDDKIAAKPKSNGTDAIGDLLDRTAPEAKKVKPAKTLKVAKAAAPASDSGSAEVQIGAFSSQAKADQGWSAAAGVAPGAMAGRGKKVVAVSVDGRTLYRTSITGFSSRDSAQALCARLQAAGRTCFVR